MAVKTKDFVVDVDNLQEDILIKTKQGTALYFKGKTFQDVICDNAITVVGNDLVITTLNSKKITILDYFKQNGKNSFKYIKTDEVNELGFLTNIIDSGVVQNPNKIAVPIKGTTVNGTVFSDEINVSSYVNIPISGKGLNIKANSGNDLIVGSLGNDTITAGTGANTIEYKELFGNDVINLTKNENLKIDLSALNINSTENIYQIVKNNLLLNTAYGTITIKNFVSKDVTGVNGSVEVILADKTIDLNSTDIHKYFIYDETDISSKRSITTKRLSEVIDMTDVEQVYDKKGNPLTKGVNINAGGGDDEITGSKFNDTIKGGLGENTINYSLGNGNDIINLTKGENLTIDLKGISASDVEYSVVKKDLVLTFSNGETLTLKNFGTKDVTNNSTKKVENTSSVVLTFDGKNPIDLRMDNYLPTAIVEKSKYSGNWHSETINAENCQLYKKVKVNGKKVKVENNDVNAKGVSIKSSSGNDVIVGSKYKDTIKGGNDNDTIIAGTGNDKIYGDAGKNYIHFNYGDGADTVYSDKIGNDTLVFENTSLENLTFTRFKNNLVITGYGNSTDSVTVTNYYKGYNSVQSIKTKEGEFKLPDNFINLPIGTSTDDYIWGTSKSEIINANSGNDVIIAANGNDTINVGAGNDTVIAGKGNDSIISSNGNNTYIFNTADGQDIIQQGSDTDTIKFVEKQNLIYSKNLSTSDLIISYGNKDSITLEEYFSNGHSVQNIVNGDKNVLISEEIKKALTILDTTNSEEINGIKGNDVFVLSGGNDTVNSSGGVDTIKFENPQELTYRRQVANNDLIIEYGSGNSVTIKDYYSSNGTSVKNIQNGNSTETLQQALQNGLKIELSDTNTSLDLTSGDNEVTSGKGNDTVNITGGNNLIIFNKNSGNDTITGYSLNDTLKFEDDTVHSWEKNAGNLVIYYNEVGGVAQNTVTLKDFFLKENSNVNIIDDTTSSTVVDYAVIYINGSSTSQNELEGTILKDYITGGKYADTIHTFGNNDTINAAKGNDSIVSWGACTYEFSLGDGNDTLECFAENSQIVFLAQTDISYSKNADSEDLIISYNNAQDTITIKSYFLGQSVGTIKNGSKVLDLSTEIAKKLTIIGSDEAERIYDEDGNDLIYANSGDDSVLSYSGNDTIYLGTGNDILSASSNTNDLIVYGDAGNDSITSGDGNDSLYGGIGNDTLNGNQGDNTYFFNNGDGLDTITINGSTSGTNIIKFNDTQTDISYLRTYGSYDVVISYNNSQDSITIENYFLYLPDIKIKNGSNISSLGEEIANKGIYVGTNGSDSLVGTAEAEKIYGLVGNDTINGYSGSDTICGGKGNDYIIESSDDNTYLFNAGDGHDIIKRNGTINGIYDFGEIDDIHFQKNANSNDLIIYYNDYNDSVTLLDYFSSYNNCQRTIKYDGESHLLAEQIRSGILIKGTGADDEIDVLYGTSTIDGGAGNNKYIIPTSSTTTILNGLGNDTISYQTYNDTNFSLARSISNNDLIINISYAGIVILKDYFVNNTHSVSTIIRDNDTLSISDLLVAGYQTYGTEEADTISGTLGNDYIEAKSGNDIIYGRDGNDTIVGGIGDDTLYGCTDSSSETITTDDNEYVFKKGHGKDTVILGRGTDTLHFKDVELSELSYSKEGNNLVINYSNADSVILKDYLASTMPTVNIIDVNGVEKTLAEVVTKLNITGSASIAGTSYNDYIVGSDNLDEISAGNGNDSIYSGAGNDRINCSYGNDYVEAGEGNDVIQGEYNDDTLLGGAGNDYIYGGLGNDSLIGNEGNDSIYGNDGSDIIEGSTGNDYLDGGAGNNIYIFNENDGCDTILKGEGNDTILFETAQTIEFNKTLSDNNLLIDYGNGDRIVLEDYFVDNSHSVTTIINGGDTIKLNSETILFGTDKADTFVGTDNSDYIFSGAGNDSINAGTGNDTIIADEGNDTIKAGAGNDIISTGLGSNEVIINSNSGHDTYIYGGGNDTIKITTDYYNDSINYYVGNMKTYKDGSDLIIKYGEDTLSSLTISDYFNIETPSSIRINAYSGLSVRDYSLPNFILTESRDNAIYIDGKNDSEQLIGSQYDDYILGNDGNDTIIAGIGNDILKGGAGDDEYQIANFDSLVQIEDTEGTNILKLTSLNKDDLSIHFDGYDKADLYITKRNAFGTEDVAIQIDLGTSDGKLSKIVTADGYYIDSSRLETAKQEVIAWFNETGMYGNMVQKVIDFDVQNHVEELKAIFDSAWQPV